MLSTPPAFILSQDQTLDKMVWKVTQWFFRPTTENKVFWSPSLPLFPKVQSLPEQHLAVPSVTVLGRFTFRKSCSQKLFFRCAGISVRSSFSKEFSKTFKVLFNYQVSFFVPAALATTWTSYQIFSALSIPFFNFFQVFLTSTFLQKRTEKEGFEPSRRY